MPKFNDNEKKSDQIIFELIREMTSVKVSYILENKRL